MTERRIPPTPAARPARRRAKPPADAPRANRPRAVAEIVPDIGRAAFRRFGFVQSAVVSRWAEIVGPRYAGVASPESIRFPQGERADGVLTLAVAGAHAATIQHVAPELIERVNRFFGYSAVARVRIVQGAARLPRRSASPAAAPPPPSAELGESLRAIADPELRAVLESLGQGLAAGGLKLGRIG